MRLCQSMRSGRRVLAGAICAGLGAGIPAAVRAAAQFDLPFSHYRLDLVPGAMALADLNGDGWQDWILCSAVGQSLDILAGTPGGNFDPTPIRVRWTSDQLTGATAVHVADTDRDGILDLVIGGVGVGALHGRGGFDYEFIPLLPALRGVYVPGSVLGDIDADGDLDFVVSTYAGGPKVETLLGNGTGVFSHGPVTTLSQLNPTTGSGHFDAGPTLDVVVGGERGTFVLLGQPDGFLLGAGRVGSSEYTNAVGVGDVDGDGLDDLAIADRYGTLTVWMGPGFRRWVVLDTPPSQVVRLLIADLNDDGFPDVGALRQAASRVDVYPGHGDGTFAPPLRVPVATAPAMVLAADLDADQALELLVASPFAGWAGVHHNHEGFLAPGRVLSMGSRAAGLAVADWNADGHVDVAVSDPDHGDIVLRHSTAAADFLPPVRLPTGGVPGALQSGDWNHDGQPDLFFIDAADASLAVMLSTPQHALGPRLNLGTPRTDVFALADLDGDGVPDAAGASSADTPLQLVWIALADGTGGVREQHGYELPGRPAGVTLADWDQDGHPDVLVPCKDLGEVVWLRANGDGTFQPATVLVRRTEPSDVAGADFDHDGTTDLAVAHAGTHGLTLFKRTASGGLEPSVLFNTGGAAAGLDPVDLDGDGVRDLVLAAMPYESLEIVDGGRGLTHADLQRVAAGHVTAMAAADANGDGLPELWVADDGAGTVSLLANRSTRTPVFTAGVQITVTGTSVQLEWRFAARVALPQQATVERSTSAVGPWDDRARVAPVDPVVRFEDAAPVVDTWYRLRLAMGQGDFWTAPVLAPAAAGHGTRLDAPREIAGSLAIRFDLATAKRARLAVFDARGRRLQAWTLQGAAPRAEQVVWDRRDAAGSHVGRGIVFVRLDAAGTRRIRKAVLCQP